jgi:protein-disulfide isomerase
MSGLKTPVSKKDHQTGNSQGTITLVEYGDYQCPHCGIAHPFLKRLLKEFEDLRLVFRNFPLQDAHPAAMISAQAAEAASKQGKFWEMHDKIYEHQTRLSDAFLVKAADELRLDSKQFLADMESDEISARIEADFEDGIVSGVDGTPSFFLNGVKLNSYDETYDSLALAVEKVKKTTR